MILNLLNLIHLDNASAKFFRSWMNNTVLDPCDDFYRFSCSPRDNVESSAWSEEMPGSPIQGSTSIAVLNSQRRFFEMIKLELENIISSNEIKSKTMQKITRYYINCREQSKNDRLCSEKSYLHNYMPFIFDQIAKMTPISCTLCFKRWVVGLFWSVIPGKRIHFNGLNSWLN